MRGSTAAVRPQAASRRMSPRGVIGTLWGGAFVVCLGMTFSLFFAGWIEEDNLRKLVSQLSESYSVYLTSIAAFYYGRKHAARRGPATPTDPAAFTIALLATLLYNAAIVTMLARVVLLVAAVEPTMALIGYVSSTLSWVVAPAVAYFFVKVPGQEK